MGHPHGEFKKPALQRTNPTTHASGTFAHDLRLVARANLFRARMRARPCPVDWHWAVLAIRVVRWIWALAIGASCALKPQAVRFSNKAISSMYGAVNEEKLAAACTYCHAIQALQTLFAACMKPA